MQTNASSGHIRHLPLGLGNQAEAPRGGCGAGPPGCPGSAVVSLAGRGAGAMPGVTEPGPAGSLPAPRPRKPDRLTFNRPSLRSQPGRLSSGLLTRGRVPAPQESSHGAVEMSVLAFLPRPPASSSPGDTSVLHTCTHTPVPAAPRPARAASPESSEAGTWPAATSLRTCLRVAFSFGRTGLPGEV